LDEHFKPKVDDATGCKRGDCLVGDEAVIAKKCMIRVSKLTSRLAWIKNRKGVRYVEMSVGQPGPEQKAKRSMLLGDF
jgi:hypothetical protein